jgi:hypothetical protein
MTGAFIIYELTMESASDEREPGLVWCAATILSLWLNSKIRET